MATTNINVRVDTKLKQSAEALFEGLGPNVETRAALAECDEMKKNPGNYAHYHSFDTLMDEVFTDT